MLVACSTCLSRRTSRGHPFHFQNERANPTGKYRLRLYDGQRQRWENIIIDDHIPCDGAAYERDGTCKPMFSQPNGNELYAMLLEKAFAKFCGSYAALEGGHTIWAIHAMTGDPARWFQRKRDQWERWDMVPEDHPTDKRNVALRKKGEAIAHDDMFQVLLKYHKLGSILCASGASGEHGLISGHAYSILDVKKVTTRMHTGETFKLVQVRNPWGSGEWNGAWSDKSDLWNQHPTVMKACRHSMKGDTDDGAFWMSWEDFLKNWEKIGVIDRTIDITTMSLTVFNDSACSPVAACLKGCCRFWFCCLGIRRLYCPHRSSEETVKIGGCCGMGQKSAAPAQV